MNKQKYLFTNSHKDKYSESYFGFINYESMKISSSGIIPIIYPKLSKEENINCAFSPNANSSIDLLTIDENIDLDVFYIEYCSGEKTEKSKPAGLVITVDKDCKIDTLKNIIDIVFKNNSLSVPISIVQLTTSFYIDKNTAIKKLSEMIVDDEDKIFF